MVWWQPGELAAKTVFSSVRIMPHYRVYILGRQGAFEGAVNFDCADNKSAEEHVKALLNGQPTEVWRLVARIENPPIEPKS